MLNDVAIVRTHKKLPAIMLDIETLGTGNEAAIVQIGAVTFNPITGEVGREEFNTSVIPREGAQIDYSTVKWWSEQEEAARRSIFSDAKMEATVLLELNAFAVDNCTKEPEVWANPPSFDCTILRSGYQYFGQKPFWGFRQERCFRTFCTIMNVGKDRVQPEVAHIASQDALAQAKTVIAHYG